MIFGIGTDLLRIDRGERLWTRFGEHAADKLLMPEERPAFDASVRRGHQLARAFAAKEAFVKALGTGFLGVGYRDAGVVREVDHRPELVFSASMGTRLKALGITSAHLSLTDDADYVMAFVVLEAEGRATGQPSVN